MAFLVFARYTTNVLESVCFKIRPQTEATLRPLELGCHSGLVVM